MSPEMKEVYFHLAESKTVPLTREVVAEINGLPASPTERDLNLKRVNFLFDRLKRGLFHPPHWVIAKVGKKTYRANGQHSTDMLLKADGHFPVDMHAHIDVFECADIDSLAMLFRQFDDRRSARSPADIAGAYQGLITDLDDVDRSVGKLAVESICWYRKFVLEQETPKDDDRYVVFNEEQEHPFIKWLGSLFSGSTEAHRLAKLPVIAAAYVTYGIDMDAADDFWRELVAGGREYEDTYPTTVLYTWLGEVQDKVIKVKPKQLYQGTVYAWNALRDGKTEIGGIRSDLRKKLLQPK